MSVVLGAALDDVVVRDWPATRVAAANSVEATRILVMLCRDLRSWLLWCEMGLPSSRWHFGVVLGMTTEYLKVTRRSTEYKLGRRE